MAATFVQLERFKKAHPKKIKTPNVASFQLDNQIG
jgi:hypothetical protein